MTTAEVIEKKLGIKTYQNTEVMNAIVGLTPVQIVSNDPGCLHFTLINLGANDIYIWNDESVSSTHGILVPGNGGMYYINFNDTMLMPTYSWWGLAVGAATNIAVLRESILV